ncbi:hypothetical protein J4475_03270 [Candidatus Woesearchaeota archaeon]|nr:hypothetical protein [Candidatus Woesearchaeota archaeon]
MKAVKTGIDSAEETRQYLLANNLFDHTRKTVREGKYLYYPAKDNFSDSNFVIVEKELPLKEPSSLKQLLSKELSDSQLKELHRSFEIVGDIAVIEVPRGLARKQKTIAKALLKFHGNIKTVVKKSGGHKGELRIQKYRHLAGERKFNTQYLENNARFRLDIQKTYFSTRLAHERMRIAGQVRGGETVLVMFSGYGPYPIVIAKNSGAREIIGVELNGDAHMFARANVRLNRLGNVRVYHGDARKTLKELSSYRIGLKSHWSEKQIKTRLVKKPRLIELYLKDGDIENHFEKISATIAKLDDSGIDVAIHDPVQFRGKYLHLASGNREMCENTLAYYGGINHLLRKHPNIVAAISHPYQGKWTIHGKTGMHAHVETYGMPSIAALRENLLKLYGMYPAIKERLYIENIVRTFFGKPEHIRKTLSAAPIPNVAVDLAHFFLMRPSNRELLGYVKFLHKRHKTYFHILDSTGNYNGNFDGVELGKGKINFRQLLPFIDFGTVEVENRDEMKPGEMLRSYDKLIRMLPRKQFDRIIMPYPKGAEPFLAEALKSLKPGGMLHFYDFLSEKETPDKAWKKIAKACRLEKRKPRLISWVKCGQQSPRVYRVCLDVMIR